MEEIKTDQPSDRRLILAGTLLMRAVQERVGLIVGSYILRRHDCCFGVPVAVSFRGGNANVTRMKRILRTNYNIEKDL